METVIGSAVGTLIGGLITWLVAHFYYKRAADDLKEEAEQLRRLSIETLRVLQGEAPEMDVIAPKVAFETPEEMQTFYLERDSEGDDPA